MSKPPTASQNAAIAAATRAEEEAAYRQLYGKLLPDIELLRKRDYVVTRERGHFLVGNKKLDEAGVQAMAARERRLAGVAQPDEVRRVSTTASGLRVGAKIGLVPKAPAKAAPLPATKQKLSGAALAKKQRVEQHSADIGVRPRVVWLDLGLLTVDRRYQRDVGKAGLTHINAILREFNWNRYQPIVVSERADGTYAVIDGQHRLEAARKHPLVSELPCYIVAAPDIAAEASIFAAVNSRRLGLTSQQKFWAAHAAGDEGAVTIETLCRQAGVTILRSPPSYDIPPRSILSPYTLQKVLAKWGKAPLATALGLLADTHGETLNAFRSPTIVALARIAAGQEFSKSRMTATLRGLDLGRVYDDARRERVTGGGTLETATERVLRSHYERTARRKAA
jgi:hypothetical protein